jgi:hypothetical protein
MQVTLPPGRASQADQWRTTNPQLPKEQQFCQGEKCVAYGAIECVKKNAAPLGKSWGENIGCFNSGGWEVPRHSGWPREGAGGEGGRGRARAAAAAAVRRITK